MTIACLLLLTSRSVLAGPNTVAANYGNITIYQVEPKFMPAMVVEDAFPVTVTNLPVGPSRVPSRYDLPSWTPRFALGLWSDVLQRIRQNGPDRRR